MKREIKTKNKRLYSEQDLFYVATLQKKRKNEKLSQTQKRQKKKNVKNILIDFFCCN